MSTTFDNNLMPAFHQNDPGVIEVIFREHYSSMVQYAVQLINDQQEAEEMVVNTFLKLITMRRNFKMANDIKTFLLVTIRNNCYDYLRYTYTGKISPKELLSLSDLVQTKKDGAPVPFTTEMLTALYEGINKLTAQTAEVFKLLFYNKMTIKDVAAQLGIPVKTVRVHKAKAVRSLRTVLSKSAVITSSLN